MGGSNMSPTCASLIFLASIIVLASAGHNKDAHSSEAVVPEDTSLEGTFSDMAKNVTKNSTHTTAKNKPAAKKAIAKKTTAKKKTTAPSMKAPSSHNLTMTSSAAKKVAKIEKKAAKKEKKKEKKAAKKEAKKEKKAAKKAKKDMKKTAKKEKKELKEAGSNVPASNSTTPAKVHLNSTGKSSSKSASPAMSSAERTFIKKFAAAKMAHLKAKTASKSFSVQGHELATIAAAE